MASSPSPSLWLFTRDLAAYADAELNEYLDVNGGSACPEFFDLFTC